MGMLGFGKMQDWNLGKVRIAKAQERIVRGSDRWSNVVKFECKYSTIFDDTIFANATVYFEPASIFEFTVYVTCFVHVRNCWSLPRADPAFSVSQFCSDALL